MKRENIFISYCHHDSYWLEKIQIFLKPLVRSIKINVWDDKGIVSGSKWKDEIERNLQSAQIAILLVTPNFLASDFIADHELPKIFRKAEKEGLLIFWISISHCLYDETELKDFQCANNPSRPLDNMPEYEQNQRLTEICQDIKNAVLSQKITTVPEIKQVKNIEIAPDDWHSNKDSLLGKIKKLF